MKRHMENELMDTGGFPQSGLLHNTGGPRSRTRIEEVSESVFQGGGRTVSAETFRLEIPPEAADPEEWLRHIALRQGFADWESLERFLVLPDRRMLAVETEVPPEAPVAPMAILRAALILARTNRQRYLPDGPRIFTRSRLSRCVRLIEIDLNAYYAMD